MCRRSRGMDVFIKWKGRYKHFIFIKCLVWIFNMRNFIGILIYRKTFSAKSVFELLESILQILGSWPIMPEEFFNEICRRWDTLGLHECASQFL
jgi:hypothetical protein